VEKIEGEGERNVDKLMKIFEGKEAHRGRS
jgi:hypothetical protein